MNMRNARWEQDFSPIDETGTSFVDKTYTKAYLHHPFKAGEMTAAMIATEHNLAFYLDLVRTARKHIADGDFAAWKDTVIRTISSRMQ